MGRLTEARFQAAKPILDRYRDQLLRTRRLDAGQLEQELKAVWKQHYQGLKPLMIDLSKRPGYVHLAARYMEGGSPGVVSEFQGPLAELYGITHYHADDREVKRREFWERAFSAA